MFQIKNFSHFFLTPSRFLQENILINIAKDIFSAHTTHTQEKNSGESSWKYLEGASLCFQDIFSLPA